MAQAIGDPEELERFAHSLQQFVNSLNDAVGNLNEAFASLGDTWQDEKRARFRGRLQRARPAVASVQCERGRSGSVSGCARIASARLFANLEDGESQWRKSQLDKWRV